MGLGFLLRKMEGATTAQTSQTSGSLQEHEKVRVGRVHSSTELHPERRLEMGGEEEAERAAERPRESSTEVLGEWDRDRGKGSRDSERAGADPRERG